MKKAYAVLVGILLTITSAYATTVSGTIRNPQTGGTFNGSVVLTQSRTSTSLCDGKLYMPTPATYMVVNGQFTSAVSVPGNDCLTPVNSTYYTAQYKDTFGNQIAQLYYQITGTTFDLGLAVPINKIPVNINVQDILGLRSLSTKYIDLPTYTPGNPVATYGRVSFDGASLKCKKSDGTSCITTQNIDAVAECGLQGALGAGTCLYNNQTGCRDETTLMQTCMSTRCNSLAGTYALGIYDSTCTKPLNFVFDKLCTGANCLDYYFAGGLRLPKFISITGSGGSGDSNNAVNIAGGVNTPLIVAASENVIKGFGMFGKDAWTGGVQAIVADEDCIQAGGATHIEDVQIWGCGRHGIMADSTIANFVPGGQLIGVTTHRVTIKQTRGDAFRFGGGNGGNGVHIRPWAYNNQGTGFWDTSLYGNLWLSPLSTANAKGYHASSGTFIRPYSESDTLIGEFCVAAACASVISPQGNTLVSTASAANIGVTERAMNYYKRYDEAIVVTAQGSLVGDVLNNKTWLGYDPDFFGICGVIVENVLNTDPVNTVYSQGECLRRNVSGNVSGWWMHQTIKGNPAGNGIGKSPINYGDALTDSGRDLYTGTLGQAWVPNILFIGRTGANAPMTGITSGTVAPAANTWLLGDIFINSAPAVGDPLLFRNVTAGTPGTWETIRTVQNATLTTTAAVSDNVAITGVTASSKCSLTPTNASAATNIATSYVSAKAANQITVTHAVTASMTYDILCSR